MENKIQHPEEYTAVYGEMAKTPAKQLREALEKAGYEAVIVPSYAPCFYLVYCLDRLDQEWY